VALSKFVDYEIHKTCNCPDKLRANSVDSTLHQFVQAAEASRRPDGSQALRASEIALDVIRTSLRDLSAVWEGQVDYISGILLKSQDALPERQELKDLMERWGSYRGDIQAAVSSISASSDATAAIHDGKGCSDHPPSFWQRFFGIFKRR
jgi:hypothetical protein